MPCCFVVCCSVAFPPRRDAEPPHSFQRHSWIRTPRRADLRSTLRTRSRSEDERSGDVERSVCGTQVPRGHEHDVHESPHAETAKGEELSDAFLPHAQVEAVGSEAAQHDAQQKCCPPAIAPGPIAQVVLEKRPPSEAEDVWADRALRNVALSRCAVHLAGAVVLTDVVAARRLVAVAAHHLAFKHRGLVGALDPRSRFAQDGDLLSVDAGVVELARQALGTQLLAGETVKASVRSAVTQQRPCQQLLRRFSKVEHKLRLAAGLSEKHSIVWVERMMRSSTRRMP
uniref:Uncharacterized protein n=1 Tax=Ixodes ricinus TaxID=34613 RepID=A0A6B0V7N7_IXORI